jgi:hypothetical protein
VTPALQQVFDEVSKLPEREQEFIAAVIREELDSERRWDELFAKSQDVLDRLADEAIAQYKAGLTEPINLDDL